MKTWIILPYDDSPAARATLRHAAQRAQGVPEQTRYEGVVVATTGVDPDGLDRLLGELRAIAGPDVALELCLLDAGDPIGDFHRLVAACPDAVLAAPVGATGRAPWFAEACRLSELDHTLMLFLLRPAELRRSTRRLPHVHESRPVDAVVQGWVRKGADLGRALARGWHRRSTRPNAEEAAMESEPATEVAACAGGDPAFTTDLESQRGSTANHWQASS
ncbi:MAG: hypothetical protein AB7R89_24065 [Dehalococcoidia bacterium]